MQRRWPAGEDADDEDVEEVEDVDVSLWERGLLGHRVFLALLTGRGGDSCCRDELDEARTMAACERLRGLGARDEGRERMAP